MVEVSEDAMKLITTSWDASKRLASGKSTDEICDKLVILGFACFYIEASVSAIINSLGETEKMLNKYCENRNKNTYCEPGLLYKFKWFCSYHCPGFGEKFLNCSYKICLTKLEEEFKGFGKLYKFRNKLSHGESFIDLVNDKLEVEELRQRAKDIVGKLDSLSGLPGLRNTSGPSVDLSSSSDIDNSPLNFQNNLPE